MSFFEVVIFSFAWLRERNSLKYVLMTWVASAVLVALLTVVAFSLFREVIVGLLLGSVSTMTTLLLEPELVGEMVGTFFYTAFPLFVVFFLVLLHLHMVMVAAALRRANLPVVELLPDKFLKQAFLCVANPIFAIVSFFEKKFVLILVAAFVFAALTFVPEDFVSIASGLTALFLLFVYVVIVFYNMVRQSQSCAIFISQDISGVSALQESWKLTSKKFWGIIFVSLAIGFMSLVLLSVLFFVLSLGFTALFYYWLFLFDLSFQLSLLVSALALLPFAMLILSYATVGIYKAALEFEQDISPVKKSVKKK